MKGIVTSPFTIIIHFLQYAWEQLYSTTSARDVGTLYQLSQKLGKKNVFSDVKKNYKAAAEFMGEVTKAYICEAFMQWAGIASIDGQPTNIKVPPQHTSQEKKAKFVTETIGTFVDEYVLPEFDVEKVWRLQQQQKTQQKRNMTTGTI